MGEYQQACRQTLSIDSGSVSIYNPRLLNQFGFNTDRFPFSIIILLEQILRNQDGSRVTEKDVKRLANWSADKPSDEEIAFVPTRVVLQDFTGVPSLVDLAALRDAMAKRNLDPELINPTIPVDLIIDHSVQVDHYGSKNALNLNSQKEFERNLERYKFLKWGQNSFRNLRVFPPGAGIIHQVNLEYLSPLAHKKDNCCFADTVVGTDSHTTMINGLGVLGWGVGGIEAESAMLGQPIFMKIPEVVGFKLTGTPPKGVTATDMVLRITEMLRQKGVVEKFVEFYGSGLDNIGLADRATIANMSPEYGATMGYFPVDKETLNYLQKTGRDQSLILQAENYFRALGIFRDENTQNPLFSDNLELDLSSLEPAIAGPKRPQDRISLKNAKSAWQDILTTPVKNRGFELDADQLSKTAQVPQLNQSIGHGSVVIAAITSCTNTSNPALLITAGLVAKKASQLGLTAKPWVKTSLAPGSQVVTDYLKLAGLQEHLEKLGFFTVGYGCTTCIGNSGPLDPAISNAIKENDLVVCSVLSGNRNFEGRIHTDIKANYLASPPLVVCYAICGTMNIDLTNDPIGTDNNGNDVYLKDIWPSAEEVAELTALITPQLYSDRYKTIQDISPDWKQLTDESSKVFQWDGESTYIQHPPFFNQLNSDGKISDIIDARALLKLGDSVTTDHISPAGSFSDTTPAGEFLISKSVDKQDFNTYGARRGNDRVMVRGTFANVRIRNQLAPQTEGGFTKLFPEQEVMTVFEAANRYKQRSTPCIVIAGAEYGSGSSRDWAAKGPFLLGVKAVVVVSFERIHRSNLIGMGILPLQFENGQNADSLGIKGDETFSILGLSDDIKPAAKLILKVDQREIPVLCRLDTEVEIDYYRNGGILNTVLLDIIKKAS